ncbi:MAG: alpha/beta hydrolase [Leptolyngbya sp. RL_3_1]|nr:alpha/beta hydrolase [Leptolyngbya sp. RL_3_1]
MPRFLRKAPLALFLFACFSLSPNRPDGSRSGSNRIIRLGLVSSAIFMAWASPASAVEEIVVQLGPLHTRLKVQDLEQVATTDQVPPGLRPYRFLLTPAVRQTLRRPLSLDPQMSDRIVADLLSSKNGQQLLALLAEVAPGLSSTTLQAAIQTAAQAPEGLSLLGVLQALPGERLTLKAGVSLTLLAQFGLSQWEQLALSNVLNQTLVPENNRVSALPFNPAMAGSEPLRVWSLALTDSHRERQVPIDIYYSRHTRGPLVLLSHGFGADREFLAYLAEHLVSHGLTVVSIEHPGSNVKALTEAKGAILPASEFIDRPLDVRLVLDYLAELNAASITDQQRFNLDQVTLIGHSLGGYTGLALAGAPLDLDALNQFCQGLAPNDLSPADWLQCAATDLALPPTGLADDRITQLVIMNPIIGQLFGAEGLSQVEVPTLILTGTEDGVTPSGEQQLRPFEQLSGPRALVAVIGGTHLSVGDPDNLNHALTQLPLMPERPIEETAQLRTYLKGTLLSFIMQQTPQRRRYQPFLSATYAEQFSTEALPLRYGDHLPSSVTHWLQVRQALERHLNPSMKSVASLLHLGLIGFQSDLTRFRRTAFSQIPRWHRQGFKAIAPNHSLIQRQRWPALLIGLWRWRCMK